MSFAFPSFSTPISLGAERSWTATFDSYDQRNDDVYYRITVDGSTFMAQVSVSWAGDDWTTPEFYERLQRELHRIAAVGQSNTSYFGSMLS